MKTGFILFLSFVAATTSVDAQQSWQDQLKRDLVIIENDMMVMESFSLDRIKLPEYEPLELQIAYRSEAPTSGFISRDNFVAASSVISAGLVQALFAEALNITASEFFTNYKSQEISQPIGKPDIQINIYMTNDGFQIEIVNTSTDEKTRTTETWDRVFETK